MLAAILHQISYETTYKPNHFINPLIFFSVRERRKKHPRSVPGIDEFDSLLSFCKIPFSLAWFSWFCRRFLFANYERVQLIGKTKSRYNNRHPKMGICLVDCYEYCSMIVHEFHRFSRKNSFDVAPLPLFGFCAQMESIQMEFQQNCLKFWFKKANISLCQSNGWKLA